MRDDYHHMRPSLVQKIDYSISVLKKAEPLALKYDGENGFHLAFSGGKDSQCLYHVAQLAGVRFKAHFSPTSIDPPQLIRFLRTHYPDVEFGKLEKSIYQVATEKKILPSSTVRWCCAEFKEMAGAGKVTLIGIRHAESARRKRRNEFEASGHKFSGNYEEFLQWQQKQIEKIKKRHRNINHDEFSIDKESEIKCVNGKDSILVSPIIYWEEKDVWDFLNGMEIEHCELYDNGYKRIGCILCPMSSRENKRREDNDFPHVKRNWIKAIKCIRNGTDFFGKPLGGSLPPLSKTGRPTLRSDYPPLTRKTRPTKEPTMGYGEFSGIPASDASPVQGVNMTEDEIAEAIYDWWVSGKAYKVWYAENYLQQRLDFGEY